MVKRVVITGLGTVNPLGNNVKDYWERVKAGENGITRITRFDPFEHPSQVAGEVKDFNPGDFFDAKDARRMDRFTVYAMAAAIQAYQDAGLKNGDIDPDRIGIVLGNGIGGIEVLGDNFKKFFDRGVKAVHPLLAPMMIINIAPGNIAIKLNLQGPCHAVVTACASGTDAIGEALSWVRRGRAEMMLAGGTEAALTPLGLASFTVLQAVSTKYNDKPDQASRPFDTGRDGFVMAEGAGVVVLEELEHAKKRGAKIYAELLGYGATCDANHLTAPHPEGIGAVRAMKRALVDGGLSPDEIDYVNAHGTSTPVNDPVESKAIRQVFGEQADKLKVSSTKSMIGHMLGAAGGVEAIVTVLGLKEQFYPPTRNLENQDPECDLDYVPNKGVAGPMRAAISNSFGFGGHNGVLVFKRYEE
ncbi:MAG: beta-ketoacyl-ACP synthase II [Spirochaetaceae bacterium]|nr:MAG: beta-ketoacyl-ACP synthase II [Spirochaetaceae bacterium]